MEHPHAFNSARLRNHRAVPELLHSLSGIFSFDHRKLHRLTVAFLDRYRLALTLI